jgi:hypothetical protein
VQQEGLKNIQTKNWQFAALYIMFRKTVFEDVMALFILLPEF